MTGIPSLFPLVGWTLQATVKGSVAILLIALAQRLIGRRVPARWRHALWLVIVLRLVVPVAPASTWSIFNLVPPHPGIQWQLRGDAGQIVFQPQAAATSGWLPMIQVPWWIAGWRWVAAIWICGIIAFASRALIATARVHWIVRRAREAETVPASASTWMARQIVEEGRRQLGIAHAVGVVESALIEVPALHGVFRPTLLLPEGLSEGFAPDELRHVILHELCHLRRHDIAVNWLLAAVQALHWFNPLVWFAISRIEEERELACDELTLSCLRQNERFGYGRTILKLLDRFRSAETVPALVGIVNPREKMRRRIMMITNVGKRSRLGAPLLAALTAICLVALTDAHGGESRTLGTLDPSGVETLKHFNGPVSLDLKCGSFSNMLNAVAGKSGIPVTQSPSIAGSPAQHARFTVHAEGVPADTLLAEALQPFRLVSTPTATGVRVTSAPACMIHHAATAAGKCWRTADGTLHRELNFNEGKLTIDVGGTTTK
jgi:beta-lactamase regulating signal transducer with metallopeptidase domain